jgi:hypothetical protein
LQACSCSPHNARVVSRAPSFLFAVFFSFKPEPE